MPRQPYPSDLADAEWHVLHPLIPPPKSGGHPRTVNLREIVNGLFYVSRTGCRWRALPHDLPPWSTVYDYFRRVRADGTWARLNQVLREQVRLQEGREATPSAAILDTQSVKTTEKGGLCGYDAGTHVKGRKRHLLVDTLGLVLLVLVHSAGVSDSAGARLLLTKITGLFPRLTRIWADGTYRGTLLDWAFQLGSWIIDIVTKDPECPGFQVVPRRWVVERTFAWLGRFRRVSKEYEYLPESSEAMIYLAMLRLMVARLAKTTRPQHFTAAPA